MPIIKLVVGYAVNAWLLTLLAVIGIYSIVGMTYLLSLA